MANDKLIEDFRVLKSSVDSLKLEAARLNERRAFLVSRMNEILVSEKVSNVEELKVKYGGLKADLEASVTQWKETLDAVKQELSKN